MKIKVITNDRPILLGKCGENEATLIRFPINVFFPFVKASYYSLAHQRHGDVAPYLCVISKNDGVIDESGYAENPNGNSTQAVLSGGFIDWPLNSADVANQGNGTAQLTAYNEEGLVVKTAIFTTVVTDSLGYVTPPAPQTAWVDQVAGYARTAEDAAVQAAASAGEVRDLLSTKADIAAVTITYSGETVILDKSAWWVSAHPNTVYTVSGDVTFPAVGKWFYLTSWDPYAENGTEIVLSSFRGDTIYDLVFTTTSMNSRPLSGVVRERTLTSGGGLITVDDVISTSSRNPVENRVIAASLPLSVRFAPLEIVSGFDTEVPETINAGVDVETIASALRSGRPVSGFLQAEIYLRGPVGTLPDPIYTIEMTASLKHEYVAADDVYCDVIEFHGVLPETIDGYYSGGTVLLRAKASGTTFEVVDTED